MTKLSERQLRWLLGGVGVGCFTLLMALETMTQTEEITPLEFFGDAMSLLLTIGAAVGVALLLQRIHAQHEEQMALTRDLAIARAEGDAWRSKVQSHLAGLKGEMDKQFEDWGMTTAEREVGLLILKGLSHKEIAVLRATTDATVRQQAQAIYRKARLPGKTAFSAYFLEDLFASDVVMEGSTPNGSPGHGAIFQPERAPMARRAGGNGRPDR
jgi:DNA-binding CsgD family transcriptional regulator